MHAIAKQYSNIVRRKTCVLVQYVLAGAKTCWQVQNVLAGEKHVGKCWHVQKYVSKC